MKPFALLSVAAVVIAAYAIGLSLRASSGNVSPVREASLYVKAQARAAGVTILGDKIWAVRRNGPQVTVVVRVRYVAADIFGMRSVNVTTIFVHLLKADYVVTG